MQVVEDAGGLAFLRKEIEDYNPNMKLIANPTWLSSEINRQKKMHASVILAFATESEAKKALRTGIEALGIKLRTAEYRDAKPNEQCIKCQKYGHSHTKCTQSARCKWCAGSHMTNVHKCQMTQCKERQPCAHLIPKCANCNEKHEAASNNCTIRAGVQPYDINRDPLALDN